MGIDWKKEIKLSDLARRGEKEKSKPKASSDASPGATSVWKKEVSLRRKKEPRAARESPAQEPLLPPGVQERPAVPAPASAEPRSAEPASVWKKEIRLRRKPKEQSVEPVLPALAAPRLESAAAEQLGAGASVEPTPPAVDPPAPKPESPLPDRVAALSSEDVAPPVGEPPAPEAPTRPQELVTAPPEPGAPPEPKPAGTSVWKKEIGFARKPKEPKPATVTPATSVWKKEISLRRKAQEPKAATVMPDAPAAAGVKADPTSVWKKEIGFRRKPKEQPVGHPGSPVEAEPAAISQPAPRFDPPAAEQLAAASVEPAPPAVDPPAPPIEPPTPQDLVVAASSGETEPPLGEPPAVEAPASPQELLTAPPEPGAPPEPNPAGTSVWKKEIGFARKPKEPKPATATPATSVWKKEISLRRKAQEPDAATVTPAAPAAAGVKAEPTSVWKKEISFGRKAKEQPVEHAGSPVEPAPPALAPPPPKFEPPPQLAAASVEAAPPAVDPPAPPIEPSTPQDLVAAASFEDIAPPVSAPPTRDEPTLPREPDAAAPFEPTAPPESAPPARAPEVAVPPPPRQPPHPTEPTSVWKKEIGFGRKPKEPKPATVTPATSVWKKEIGFGRKPKEPKAATVTPAAPAAAGVKGEPTSVWKKEIGFRRKPKAPRSVVATAAPPKGRSVEPKAAPALAQSPLMRAFNLLPKEDPRQAKRRRPSTPQLAVGVAGIALFTILASVFLLTSAQVSDKRNKADELRIQLAQLEVPVEDPAEQADPALVEEQRARTAALGAALGTRLVWDRLLREFSLVLPEDVWVSSLIATGAVRSADPAAAPAPSPAQGVPTPASGANSFTVTGFTRRQDSVAQLLARLSVLPELSNVQLVSSTRAKIGETPVYQFSIVAAIKPGGAAA